MPFVHLSKFILVQYILRIKLLIFTKEKLLVYWSGFTCIHRSIGGEWYYSWAWYNPIYLSLLCSMRICNFLWKKYFLCNCSSPLLTMVLIFKISVTCDQSMWENIKWEILELNNSYVWNSPPFWVVWWSLMPCCFLQPVTWIIPIFSISHPLVHPLGF